MIEDKIDIKIEKALKNKDIINNSYTDGNNDQKIDAIIIDDKKVICIQSTISSDFNSLKEKYEVFLQRVNDLFFTNDPKISS